MTKMEPRPGPSRPWTGLLGILLVLGSLAALWRCAQVEVKEAAPRKATLEAPAVIRTTIRITKGRPGQPSLWAVWNVSPALTQSDAESLGVGVGVVIPAKLWARMNGTVVSFREFGCDGVPRDPSMPLYRAKDGSGAILKVTLTGKAGERPDWSPIDCPDLDKPCTLPAYYFGGVVEDENTCPAGGPELRWEMVLG